MASLKFIMDVDDDQPDRPPAGGSDRDLTLTRAAPHSYGHAPPGSTYARQVTASELTRQASNTSMAGSQHGGTMSSAFPASTAATGSTSSNRRRSSASNDSADYAGYGSAASSSSTGAGLNPSNTLTRPMPGSTGSDMPLKYTPITGRVSRARKGIPVHTCEICRPPKTFTRAEHLRRHQLSHQTPGYPCTYPGCDRSFHRPDLLARHQARHTEPGDGGTSSASGGGEVERQAPLQPRASNIDLADQSRPLSDTARRQTTSSNPNAPPSDTSSTNNFPRHAPGFRPPNDAGSPIRPSPAPDTRRGGGAGYGFLSTRPQDSRYSTIAHALPLMSPSSNVGSSLMSDNNYPSAVNIFQQPQATPSVFATQGVSLPSLSIPENNLPELYHPEASPWTSSASDSTYSPQVSDNARNPRFWLGQHRSPTGDWPPTNLLCPYPDSTSRDPPRARLDATSTAVPASIFAGPFQTSHFSATAQDPNYDITLGVPMAGFGSIEHSGRHVLTPTSQMTFRPHHRHSTSLSSMQSIPLGSSGSLTTPMQDVPSRTTVLNTLGRHKDQGVNMSGLEETYISDSGDFNVLGQLGGGCRDLGPGSSNDLLAALDLSMTGCGATSVVAVSSQQLSRKVLPAVPGYIEVYWQRFHPLYPIVHRGTLEAAGEDVLRWAMAAVATQYLDTKEDRLHGNQLHEHAWQELKTIPHWNLQVMQAILLCEIFARFRGRKAVTRPSKMFESLYSRVLYHNPSLYEPAVSPTDNSFQLEERWQAWVDAEARRRLLTACFITDVHASAFQQQKRAHDCGLTREIALSTVPLSRSSSVLWEAHSAASWASILAANPESAIPVFAHTSSSLTASSLASLPVFDSSAILALELVLLPRPLTSDPPPPPPLPPLRPDFDDSTLDPLIRRPRSTPGYSTTSPIDPTFHDPVLPVPSPLQAISCAASGASANPPPPVLDLGFRRHAAVPSRTSTTSSSSPATTTEARIASLFPSCPCASTYLALHHTPLHDLLAVSGDTWMFSQKVLPATCFLERRRRLKAWVEDGGGGSGRTGWEEAAGLRQGSGLRSGPGSGSGGGRGLGLSAARATIYAARAILAFLGRGGDGGETGGGASARSRGSRWMVDLSDYWGLYVCALICWAFGHRGRVEGTEGAATGSGTGSRPASGSEGGGRQEGAAADVVGDEGGDAGAIQWLRMVSEMEPEETVKIGGGMETLGVVALVRRALEWDCVGGRSRLYVDAVGVLKRLEEGANWKWF